jgi:DNA/RNA-binding domain of Phe-tRNA-synthetase-like protein
MRLEAAGEVCSAFPGLRIDAVVADGFSGQEPWPEVEQGLSALEARTGRLPRINPAVDCCNLVAAESGITAGAFDLREVVGNIVIRFADGSEAFTPLGEAETVENPSPGEVVYTDAAGVLTRHWNHRDAERTKVTEESDCIVFLLETVDEAAFGPAVEAAAGRLASLLHTRSDAVAVYPVTAESPVAVFEFG